MWPHDPLIYALRTSGWLSFCCFWPPYTLASWPPGLLASWPPGLLAFWPSGLMTSGLLDSGTSGLLDFWPPELLAFWHPGLLAFWPLGILAFCPLGILAFWPSASRLWPPEPLSYPLAFSLSSSGLLTLFPTPWSPPNSSLEPSCLLTCILQPL